MNLFNLESNLDVRVLGTDLDGTLIPLPDCPENREDLEILKKGLESGGREVVFATGRHFESVLEAIEEFGLPQPQWLICDVGTSIYRAKGGGYELYQPYVDHLSEKSGGIDRTDVEEAVSGIDGLELQGAESQGPFKISYFADNSRVDELVREMGRACEEKGLPFLAMGSVDPFNQNGLLDLLPAGVSKAYALIWLATHADFRPEELVFSGDSGNDYAALVAGFRSIAVGNAASELVEKVAQEMKANGASERFYAAKAFATSGVLEGCRHFGLLPQEK
ncbi:HAD-IIB family hydrolase [Puniceicoccus vermicola]|uniref:HAD-IIB family hydrolase n=1 Tax=Puniceicoccus vermicola TaxID=388746 RepID=A0A7X1AUU3_9BACT|nr:HAD-IIB family hydrolase [Puniceicoccus vermicola]MBC2600284.1 HAD-IIB family hydrolase [Puniceicoccus vermicola]